MALLPEVRVRGTMLAEVLVSSLFLGEQASVGRMVTNRRGAGHVFVPAW